MTLMNRKTAALICAANVIAAPAFALDEIYSPNVEYRELSVEWSGSRTFDSDPNKNNAQGQEFVVEAGLAPRWVAEVSAGFSKDPDTSLKLEDVEIENRFQFFESGEYWLDSGMLVAYDFSTQSHASDNLEAKLLLQKDFGKFTSTVNVGFDQAVGEYHEGGPDYVFLMNTRYRYNLNFQPGIEIQSDLGQDGQIRYFNQQQQYIGPALWGEVIPHLKYQAAFFVGASEASAATAARLLFEYEMHF